MHDSQVVDDILDPDNTASEVWADSAYRSAEIEAQLKEKGLKSRIHRKGAYRNKPLSEREKRGNTTRSKVRARVEHVFGAHRATTWAGRWCAASGWYGRGRGSG